MIKIFTDFLKYLKSETFFWFKLQSHCQGLLFLEFDSKIKLGDQLKNFRTNKKNWGFYNLSGVIISSVLSILVSQNRFQSLYDEIFNIDRFVE